MSFFSDNRRIVTKWLRTLFFATLVFYFSYHTISGEKGIMALVKMEQKLSVAKAESKESAEKRKSLQHKVNMMYSRSLDTDLLEEQAKKLLGRAKPSEIVHFYN